MEVYPRSSWFLLLLGFALIAVTLQGVQGVAETDGPSETDCRPYIEKALKELEIGEVGQKQKESSEEDESAEDIPTVEIIDDSSHQEEDDGGQGELSEEAKAREQQGPESTEESETQQEAAQGSTEEDKSDEDSSERPDEKEVNQNEEKAESEKNTKVESSEDESAKESEQENNSRAGDDNEDENEVQQETPEHQVENVQILRQNIPTEKAQSIPVQATTDSQEESTEYDQRQSDEDIKAPQGDTDTQDTDKSKEEVDSREDDDEKVDEKSDELETEASKEKALEESNEDEQSGEQDAASTESTEKVGCPDPSQVSCTEGELCSKHRNCGENQICCPNKCYRKRCLPGSVSEAELEAESEESQEEAKSEKIYTPTVPETGCPPTSQVSCTEGELCSKHKNCGEDQICCPNKCYRKRCLPGTATSAELEAESDEDSKEDSKEEILLPAANKRPETGCPATSDISCTEGDLCSKHKHCSKGSICCPNKCYRKRCTPGTPTAEELEAEESDEDSKEKEAEIADVKTVLGSETGCPAPGEVSCTEGTLCNKHKQCGAAQMCCPNKCYRKRCIPGTATSAELEAESDEDSKEDSKEEIEPAKRASKGPETGCPAPGEVSCTEGTLCNKHKQCGAAQMCCPNKCYRKRCIPGTATSAELEAESDEDSKEDSKEEIEPAKRASKGPDTGCPQRNEVACSGQKCSKNKECGASEICCANKCYRKVCIPGTPGSEEEDDSEEESTEDKSVEARAGSVESQEDEGACPSLEKVSCTEGKKCGSDDDCTEDEICCPNKCYTSRCVPGLKEADEKIEVEKPVEKIISQLKEVKEETKKETKAEPAPLEPKKIPVKLEAKKHEIKQPEITKPKVEKIEIKKPEQKELPKPVKVVEIVVEDEDESLEKSGEAPVEELSLDSDIPTDLRPRDHVEHLLKLDKDSSKLEKVQNKVYDETLKELKKLYEQAIKPLEGLYKYRDLSNRHFGDAEIFSKPLILFMGPWSGGKSSIINYLVNNEYNETSLRTGAEPSPAYFNILTYGDEPDVIDGTELAADFTFSGLQKFGQGLEERLRGIKLPSKLLEKVNIVEIPGILEVRKQVSRVFPFNDACQWFIDRADIIFLVYDPSKLDVGPETEAILDQLKGREHQTRIVLNKADQVKPEELMRVQGALIWNISPLMSSPQPPVMYTTSLWSRPYEPWAPVRLLHAQERAFLRDLRTAVDRRVENKIASARRFAVRVRNHAKMVDCYLTTYYNHKSVFGNRKQVANEIIEHPQDYHIYEGLSTLTNISRYDLPDPDVYRDFFKLNPLYEFQQLSATCTYFRGCPINRLDIAIAYDLPELVGTYKRNLEEALANANNPPKESPPPQKPKKSAPGS